MSTGSLWIGWRPLGVKAEVMPLAVRGSALVQSRGLGLVLGFPADVQQSSAETMRFADGKTFDVISHGGGKILWTADPVEFAEGYDATAVLYHWALQQAGVQAPFQEVEPLSPDVLAFPTVLENAEMYCFSNETMDAQRVDFTDTLTHAHVLFTMQPQRGAALLLSRQGQALASYGGAALATE